MENNLKKKIFFILGTRPEAIKLAPLILKFKSCKSFITKVCLTGQHKEMVDQVFDLFHIQADYDLNLMLDCQTLAHITCKVINGLQEIFINEKPNLVIVQGDTTSAFSGALSAFYQNIPIAHVEAGLRTKDIFNPFPEEANRRMISQISSLNFAPTELSAENLKVEKISGPIYVTGNTVIDSVLTISKKMRDHKIFSDDNKEKKRIFTTVHRRENWGKNIKNITLAINNLTKKYQEIEFIIPMHPNPVVRNVLIDDLSHNDQIQLLEPLSYEQLVYFLEKSFLILTDSGGLQEEAPTFGKPVLILRNNTERPEAVEAGTAKLIGTSYSKIINEVSFLIENKDIYKKMSQAKNPFGDGKSCEKILKICKEFLNV